MERRTLLKSVLALPLAAPASADPAGARLDSALLFSGLAGLDFALGGLRPGGMACVVGPACTGKTLLLLEIAARFVRRYRRNVLFYSAQKPSVYLAKKVALRGDTPVEFAGETREAGGCQATPALHLLDSTVADPERTLDFARRMQQDNAFGCGLVIWDGFQTCGSPVVRDDARAAGRRFPAERWPHPALSPAILIKAQRLSRHTTLPILLGVTMASLVDGAELAASLPLEWEIRDKADRLLALHRPALYKETAALREEEKSLVRLTGTCPEWWDTRCADLRLDARHLKFETIG